MITVNRLTLANGLRVIHSEDRATQMVALNVLYDVGARDEHPEHTGFAHLFEHLMFGGSVHIPDYDTPLQMAGGENNAWTNNDFTNYYLSVPYQNVETACWLESDRMLGLAFTPHSLEVQRQVVCEEFKQRYLNQPYGDIGHLIRSMAFRVHPYRWPTIGKDLSHIMQATLDDVRDFFYRFYAPDNAILSVSGHISAEETFRLAGKWFSSIPRRHVAPRSLPQEPGQVEERRQTVERNVPTDMLHVAFHMVSRTHPDYYVYDVLSDILGNGRSSRLTRKLVKERRVFSTVDAYVSGSVEAGLFQITGKPLPGVPLQKAEEALWEELELLRRELVGEMELEKVRNKFESSHLFGNLNYLDRAANLAFFELIGKAEDINGEVSCYRAVTSDDVRRVANEAFRRNNSSTLYYLARR